jgi:hypothetical protein
MFVFQGIKKPQQIEYQQVEAFVLYPEWECIPVNAAISKTLDTTD